MFCDTCCAACARTCRSAAASAACAADGVGALPPENEALEEGCCGGTGALTPEGKAPGGCASSLNRIPCSEHLG